MELVFDKLLEINELGVGIVMVEQNARRALALAHRGYVLDAGRNAIEGGGAELLHDPRVERALPRRLGNDRVELDLDEHALGDEARDEVGRVRRVDRRRRPRGARAPLPPSRSRRRAGGGVRSTSSRDRRRARRAAASARPQRLGRLRVGVAAAPSPRCR